MAKKTEQPSTPPFLVQTPPRGELAHEHGVQASEIALMLGFSTWFAGWFNHSLYVQAVGFLIAAGGGAVLVQSIRRRLRYEELTSFSNAENEAMRQHEIQKLAMQMTHEITLEMAKEQHAENQRQHLRWSQIVRQVENLHRSIMLAQEQLRNNPSGQDIINDLMELQRLMRTFDESAPEPDSEATMKTFERMMMARMAKQYGVKLE